MHAPSTHTDKRILAPRVSSQTSFCGLPQCCDVEASSDVCNSFFKFSGVLRRCQSGLRHLTVHRPQPCDNKGGQDVGPREFAVLHLQISESLLWNLIQSLLTAHQFLVALINSFGCQCPGTAKVYADFDPSLFAITALISHSQVQR